MRLFDLQNMVYAGFRPFSAATKRKVRESVHAVWYKGDVHFLRILKICFRLFINSTQQVEIEDVVKYFSNFALIIFIKNY